MKTKHGILALLVAFCLLVGLLPSMAFAASEVASGTCGDNLTWVLDSDGTLTISGEGKMTSSPWTTDYAEQIKTAIIEDGVTNIGNYAFGDCESLTSIAIPESVTWIDGYAFYNCTSLTSISIPDSVGSIGQYAFSGCTSLTTVNIPDGVASLYICVFENCTSLTSITIPASVTGIDKTSFKGCSSLTDIEVDDSSLSYCSVDGVLFKGNMKTLVVYPAGREEEYYAIPDSVTSISSWAFYGCTNLTSIAIPDSVSVIGEWTFYSCSSLTSVTIPDGVSSIGDYCFCGCSSLTSVDIPDSVTRIGSAFSDCTSLTSITIPDSVTSIAFNAFCNCTSLTEINVGEGNENYCSQGGVLFSKDMTELILYSAGLEGVYIIPDSVTKISKAFYGCTNLTSVTIPDSVTSIGYFAFVYCTNLTEINVSEGNETYCSQGGVLFSKDMTELVYYSAGLEGAYVVPDGVTAIGNLAFYSCTGLTSVTIPDSVTTIGESTFFDCNSLTCVTIGNDITAIGEYAFNACDNLTTIIFEGNAPVITSNYALYNAFYGVTATAYYPAGNETWTEDVMQDYGGTITWVAYTPGETADAVVSVAAGEGAPTTDVDVPLTSDDMTLGGIGVEVSYVLNVNAVESVSEEEKALIDAALDGSTAAIYLDITLNRTVDGNTAAVTETEEMVTITFTIPEEILGENRTYSVIRVHDGEAEVLPDLDEDANTVTIQTDRFSTYVLTYSETANEPTDPEPSDPEETDPEVTDPATSEPEASTPTGDNPKDGDFAPIMTCAVLMLLSAAAVVTIRKRVF